MIIIIKLIVCIVTVLSLLSIIWLCLGIIEDCNKMDGGL
jgi:hypothetical protein